MSDCERYREFLVELAYDEIDPADESRLREHLSDCEACAARSSAFASVRDELQEWDVEAPRPSRIAFVAVPAPGRGGAWSRRLATAASFLVGFLLIAAMANVEIHNRGDGWSFRTSLLPRPAESTTDREATPEAARPTSGPVERIEAQQPNFGVPVSGGSGQVNQAWLENWLEQRLQARGIQRPGSFAELRPEQVRPLLDDLLSERDRQMRALRQETLTREEFDAALAGLYQMMEAQRTNDLLFMASELGLLQEATGQELQRTNAAIDFLIGLEATEPTDPERREPDSPERREPER